jgi:FolB domain-containing protein
MDRIVIRDLLVRCVLGLTEDERREKQDVTISLALHADLRRAGQDDRVDESIDYRALKKQVLALAEASSFHLVEALAERIAALCLENPRVLRVDVTVEKPTALRFARTVGVELTRERAG